MAFALALVLSLPAPRAWAQQASTETFNEELRALPSLKGLKKDLKALKTLKKDLKPATQEHKKRINETAAPKGEPVVKTEDLEKSAVGPGYTLIPLPAFTYNRNEGSWIGALTPLFRANEKGEVEDIYAPLYLHNALIGETFTFNYFGYRNHTTQYHVILSQATKVEDTVDLSYKNTSAGEGRYIVSAQVNSGKSAFNRFFGFGNKTVQSQETTYTMGESVVKVAGGINLIPELAVIATERYRDVGLEDGASRTLPQTLDVFPTIPGIDGANVVGHSLTLSYDTRDNQLTPLEGTFATAFAEYDQNIAFSERNHWWRLTGEARSFLPHADYKAVLVSHILVDGVVGQDENRTAEDVVGGVVTSREVTRGVPFFERPSLGGETTLRGFGRGRFVGNVAWLLNFEERLSLSQRALMGNLIEVELAPFVDIGRVSKTGRVDTILHDAQVNPGVGLRLLARPNIAGRLDLGWGKDGTAVYVGLDYPF